MKPSYFAERENAMIVNNIKNLALLYHTSKADIATLLQVSVRTVENRFSGNLRTSFTIKELLELCSFWNIPLKSLLIPLPMTTQALIADLEENQKTTINLLKKQLQIKGESL